MIYISSLSIYMLASVIFFLIGCNSAMEGNESSLKINNIQVIGSHNSYKQAIEPALLQLLQKETSESFEGLQYKHASMSEQLEGYGLRNLEIDVVYDPVGGRFAKPYGLELLKSQNIETLPYDTLGVINQPGFKVLHVPDIDFRTSCARLIDCLQEIKSWSEANPNHLPICITFNAKSSQVEREGFVKLLQFTPIVYDELEKEILSVIPKERIVTPDDVRGKFETLESAVKAHHWPKLEDAKGKFILVLDESGQKLADYIKNHPSLKGRLMFVKAEPGTPEAAFIIMNDPIKDKERIKTLVKAGYLVRTRADADTKEAREGDYARFEAALSSGAQFISTDYYMEDKGLGTKYKIQLPGGNIARCNYIFVNQECEDDILE